MIDYSETVTKLRDVYRAYVATGNEKAGQFLADAAEAIETLERKLAIYLGRIMWLENELEKRGGEE